MTTLKRGKLRGEAVTLATTVGVGQTRGIPPWANYLEVDVFSATLEDISLILTPRITRLWFYDASGTSYTDFTAVLTDRNTSTGTSSSLNSMQTNDYIYVGCSRRFRGLAVDVGNANGNTSTMLVTYWNGTIWTSITPTDGTALTTPTRTLGQDGLISWTVPTDWVATTVNSEAQNLYWVRIAVDAALDSTTSILEVSTLANTTVAATTTDAEGYDYVVIQSNNRTLPSYAVLFDTAEFGGIELKSASITSAANLRWWRVYA